MDWTADYGALTYHGGALEVARRLAPNAPEPWIDLSTGINPHPYPLPDLEPAAWSRLPEREALAKLEAAAAHRYGAAADSVVAGPGSQALIHALAHILPRGAVGALGPTYDGFAAAFAAAGARVVEARRLEDLGDLDVAIVVNPNNPDGRIIPRNDLKALHERLARRGGMLVVDEAFADFEFALRSARRVSSPDSPSNGRASFGRPVVGEDQGGGSRRPVRQGRGGAVDNLPDPRDPPPLPAPTRGGGGASVIDESLAPTLPARGAVVLRSFGKAYGLAGLRLGFALASPDIVAPLRAGSGPWPVSGPAIAIGTRALADSDWLEATRARLAKETGRLDALLLKADCRVIGGTLLFRLAAHEDARAIFERLVAAGILVRPFADEPLWLRFGIPGDENGWERLAAALRG